MAGAELSQRVLAYLRGAALVRPGDRVAVAVSGGADSVALLRVMLLLRQELGLVLSVVHFDHRIRGQHSTADAGFVADLAALHGLKFFAGEGDARAFAASGKQSLETAARELRYGFFRELLDSRQLDRIATAHTLGDQAETVLMRLVRGAGTRGLAGIRRALPLGHGWVVRPLLETTRAQLEEYLRALGQPWREDATNRDLDHLRNRVRHELLPMLARDYNPRVAELLARCAAIARDEEEYWDRLTTAILPGILLPGKPVRGGGRASGPAADKTLALDLEKLHAQPLALRRRLVRAALFQLGCELDAEQVEAVLNVAARKIKQAELTGGFVASRGFRELQIARSGAKISGRDFEYELTPTFEATVKETNSRFRVRPLAGAVYNSRHAQALRLRNWRAGDRFWAAGHGAEKKVKELLQQMRVPQAERALWPVVTEGGSLIWVRGLAPHPGLRRGFDVEELP